ncbi:glycosyltransferase [Agromyces larvae]|uniref:Glycosyltransferase n=1 Tax=Agromyces larvae TaxID=2929802 RepID=A0ABY4BZA1_9MICO|nr:glycosyltransferase [Agromyces larvae]UOE44493.1 glycosyltransferase [Agromyces larvae]
MTEVSVIIPTNRIDRWLDDAIESVLASRGVEVVLVVVLDGIPVDESRPWADDPRVEIVPLPENVGQTVAMNTGVRASRTSYVARLDSDDLVDPDRLALQADHLDRHPDSPAVGSAVIRIDEHSRVTGEVALPTGDDIRPTLLLSNTVAHSSLLFRRSAFDAVGGYDERLRQMEDYDFILRIARSGPIANLPRPLIRYRVHSGQTSRGATPRGRHIDAVSRGRLELARSIGASPVLTRVKLSAWRALQFLRYHRLVRPGHER